MLLRRLFPVSNRDEDDLSGGPLILIIFSAFILFLAWSLYFELDQFVRAQGSVFSRARTQSIQTVDGGVLQEIHVREGDRVVPGQILAVIDQSRFESSTNEISARINALKGKILRLRAEVTSSRLEFDTIDIPQEIIDVETAFYTSRLKSLEDDVGSQLRSLEIAKKEYDLISTLNESGDVDQTELIRTQRAVVDAEAKLNSRKNEYFERASQELAQAENEISQSLEVYEQRRALIEASVLRALGPGIVKNIAVTTLGAVTKPGDILMEIVPTGDDLLIEARILPKDIADLSTGLTASVRLDAFDSSIYGTLEGEVSFLSADTISEPNSEGREETFYRAHISLPQDPVSSIGNRIDLIPGMNGQIDIKTGKRSVFTYITKPIVKTLNNSFGEK